MKKRLAAEWEPAIGVMVSWPVSLPKSLLKEFSNDLKLFFLIENKELCEEAKSILEQWKVNLDAVGFIVVPQGSEAQWPRDWGPQPVFTENGEYYVACPRHLYSVPYTNTEPNGVLINTYTAHGPVENRKEIIPGEVISAIEDESASVVADHFGYKKLRLPFSLTGGNVMSDGRGTIISSATVPRENNYLGFSHNDFFDKTYEYLGVNNYAITSNYEDFGIQHVDCFFKLCDEETLLVLRAPEDHPYYERYEKIVENELNLLRNCYGRPYKIFRIDTARFIDDDLAAYVNSIIINKCVYVPMYGIPQDDIAVKQWQKAMPGYEIKGFTYNLDYAEPMERSRLRIRNGRKTGWAAHDSLHCRTRAVWDPEMLYVSVYRLNDTEPVREYGYQVHVNIVDYSKAGLVENSLKLYWRFEGEENWSFIPLKASPAHEIYIGTIPAVASGSTVEYYVVAADGSGRIESAPRTAPKGFYRFKVK